ncbi:hypothetical protein APHCRT_1577 [Anaplasma phagocytophilum str. CRT53-1]|uniref:Uncharacterized protein n=1 Tax=Anaplasma phagocytophilum str. CRT53-1 TaxID=1359157 RepID=A0A0F3PJU4_ANAPH|nr:hypothetical protein APHCRT_1577 [Anaplasma phagocytophilum str. CRT53-1]
MRLIRNTVTVKELIISMTSFGKSMYVVNNATTAKHYCISHLL